jgi:hypothetical protein
MILYVFRAPGYDSIISFKWYKQYQIEFFSQNPADAEKPPESFRVESGESILVPWPSEKLLQSREGVFIHVRVWEWHMRTTALEILERRSDKSILEGAFWELGVLVICQGERGLDSNNLRCERSFYECKLIHNKYVIENPIEAAL